MANSNIASNGRYSAQMLSALGAQKTVKYVDGVPTNTYLYKTGNTTFPTPGSLLLSDIGGGVVGNYNPWRFDATKSYFLSRGASKVYADTMAALVIDMATQTGVTPQALLENMPTGLMTFSINAYRAMNNLRDPSHQLGIATDVDNSLSFQANQIRS